jgi:glycosyltransferase involved in cell wall biosynthesis
MRILALDQFSDPGGAQQCLLDLLPALRANGWMGVVAMPGEGEMFERVRAAGFETARISCGPYTSGHKTISDVARFATETPRLAQEIRLLARDTDLVYVNGPRLLPACALARLACPLVFHSHSLVPSGQRKLAGIALRSLNARVVAACNFVAAPWRAYVDRVEVVYCGAGFSLRRASARPDTVGIIGRIAPEKGLLQFVEAAAIISRVLPQCRFVVHGAPLFSGAVYEREVRAAAAGLPVEFPGWAPDVYKALAGLDLLLVPSAPHEATPRVILEAFAAGVPVVAFRSGGIPELITDGVDGCLATSVEEMAAIAVRLLSGDSNAIARAAQETWQRRFTLDRYRHDLISILNNTAAAPASTAAPVSTGP